MKSNKFYKENFKKSLDTPIFKIIFVILMIFSLYSIISCGFEMSYMDKATSSISGKYEIVFILLIMMMSTFNIFEIIESNKLYIIRFETKKKYINELIGNVIFTNSIIFILYLLFSFIFINIFSKGINIEIMENYNIYNINYFIFILFRNYIILMIISIINIMLLKLFNKRIIVLIFDVILCGIILCIPYNVEIIETVLKMPFFIGDYLIIKNYINFGLEIVITAIYIILLLIIVDICKNIFVKYIKQVGK